MSGKRARRLRKEHEAERGGVPKTDGVDRSVPLQAKAIGVLSAAALAAAVAPGVALADEAATAVTEPAPVAAQPAQQSEPAAPAAAAPAQSSGTNPATTVAPPKAAQADAPQGAEPVQTISEVAADPSPEAKGSGNDAVTGAPADATGASGVKSVGTSDEKASATDGGSNEKSASEQEDEAASLADPKSPKHSDYEFDNAPDQSAVPLPAASESPVDSGQDSSGTTADESAAVNQGESPKGMSAEGVSEDASVPQLPARPPVRMMAVRPAEKVATYNFYGEDGSLVFTEAVKAGDTLLAPEAPEVTDGRTFLGWYLKDGDTFTTKFDQFGTVGSISRDGQITSLYARFAGKTVILYYDENGILIKSQEVDPNSKVTIYPDSPLVDVNSLTACHVGWATTQNGTEDVSGELSVGTDPIKLYPIVKEGHWVTFDTDGGTSYDRQFVARDAAGEAKKVKNPGSPAKQGYTFGGWYADKGLTDEYDFSSDVTSSKTVYAKYVPKTDTAYTVRYWIEYQEDDSEEVPLNKDQGWSYKLYKTERRFGKTGDQTSYHSNYIFTGEDKKDPDAYELNLQKSIDNTISADGSTVADVYYNAKSYKISIQFDDKHDPITDDNVKYGTSLLYLWQRVFEIVPKEQLFDGKIQWQDDYDGHYGNSLVDLSKKLAHNESWRNYDRGGCNKWVRWYYETIDGEVPLGYGPAVANESARVKAGTVVDGRTYYLADTSGFSAYGAGCVLFHRDYDDIQGFHWAPFYGDGNIAHAEINGVKFIGAWFHQAYWGLSNSGPNVGPDLPEGSTGWGYNPYKYGDSDGDSDGYLDLYFWRNHYSLIFVTNHGPKLDNYTGESAIPYEKKLSGYCPSSYVPGVTEMIGSDGRVYLFDGWYADEGLVNPFDFDGTMPADDTRVYAKWIPRTYTVSFDSNGGSQVASVSNVEYGTTVAQPTDPTYDGHIFLGWALSGRPYHFANGVNDDLTLMAQWRSIDAYRVAYDLNGGRGTTPTDTALYYEDAGVPVAALGGVTAPSGKVFLGWRSSGDGNLYYPGGRAPMAYKGLTLTAEWGDAPRKTHVTYDLNYGSFGIPGTGSTTATRDGLSNNSRIDLENASAFGAAPKGWVFAGWYLDPACTDGPYTTVLVDAINDGTNVVYAKWVPEEKPSKDEPDSKQRGSSPRPASHSGKGSPAGTDGRDDAGNATSAMRAASVAASPQASQRALPQTGDAGGGAAAAAGAGGLAALLAGLLGRRRRHGRE